MPRNGTGTYALPQAAFVPNTTISSSSVNSDLTDIANALTASLCTDGQSTMGGPVKAAGGTAAAPSITFGTQQGQGFYNIDANTMGISVGGAKVAEITQNGFATAAGATLTAVTLPNYISGLNLSNDSVTPNSILDIGSGLCTDSTNALYITFGSAFTKGTGGPWTSGTSNNGMGTGLTVAINTWYHVFAIINSGSADIYFDTSVTAANKPANTTSFRRIGSFLTDSSAHIQKFLQLGNYFYIPEITVVSGSGAVSITGVSSGLMSGISVIPLLYVALIPSASSSLTVFVYSAASALFWITLGGTLTVTPPALQLTTPAVAGTPTNATNGNIRYSVTATGSGGSWTIFCDGYIDNRGFI